MKEMGVVACLIILSLIVWTYLGVNWTSLMVRRSRRQIVREKMENLENYLANTKVSEDLRRQIRDHMEIKYNDEYNNKIIEDFPASIRAKVHLFLISKTLKAFLSFSNFLLICRCLKILMKAYSEGCHFSVGVHQNS